jgi:hypothetical protein
VDGWDRHWKGIVAWLVPLDVGDGGQAGAQQEIANGLPQGGILIVLPQELKQRRAFEQTAALLKQQGKRIATISAEHFA